jgi:hypothetical protein
MQMKIDGDSVKVCLAGLLPAGLTLAHASSATMAGGDFECPFQVKAE